MKNDENYKHKFKCIVSNSKYIAGSSFICLKCEECLFGCCELKTKKFLLKNKFNITFDTPLTIKNIYIKKFSEQLLIFIHENFKCKISEEEWLIKNIIE